MERAGLAMGSILQPSAASSDTFRAAALALKLLPREVRNETNRITRSEMNPVWRKIVGEKAQTEMDRLVLVKGSRVAPGNPTVLIAASSKRPLSDGLVPDDRDIAAAFEFGPPDRNEKETYTRKGSPVTRRTKRQLPWRNDKGRVVYAAFAEIGPRLASMWVQTIVRKIMEAHEK